MSQDFLHPRLSLDTLDRYAVRKAILEFIEDQCETFHGRLLDVGCGVMPYRSLILDRAKNLQQYIGMDIEHPYYDTPPDQVWDGEEIPLADRNVDCVLATEVLEHCPEPGRVLNEIFRVLKPGGGFYFTVPFLWPLHDVPHDEYRYTPFALERLMHNAGFTGITIKAMGGWDASLAQMLGLWVRRAPMVSAPKRQLLSRLVRPVVKKLLQRDRPPAAFDEAPMITGLCGSARRQEQT